MPGLVPDPLGNLTAVRAVPRVLAASTVLGMTLAACGGETATTPTTSPSTGTTASVGSRSSATASPEAHAFCALTVRYRDAARAVGAALDARPIDSKAIEAASAKLEQLIPQLVDAAPAAVKGEVTAATDAATRFFDLLRTAHDDQASTNTVVLQAMTEDTVLNRAGQKLDEYLNANCPAPQPGS